jgi:hypothetical protein
MTKGRLHLGGVKMFRHVLAFNASMLDQRTAHLHL